jgi:hypothetical protein
MDRVTLSARFSSGESGAIGGGGGIGAVKGGGGGNRLPLPELTGNGTTPTGGGGGKLGAITCILFGLYSNMTVVFIGVIISYGNG